MPSKKSLLVGAAVATVSLGGLGSAGLVSAATSASSSGDTSIVDKIATKFGLSKSEVQAVFDEDRKTHEAERKAKQAERLATAVKDGKLTQAQADYITKARAEIESLRGDGGPGSVSDETRKQIKAKMDALRSWAEDNDVDKQYIGPGGHGGPGGPRGERPSSSATSNTN